MGSPNDREKMQPAADTLEKFGIEADAENLAAATFRSKPVARYDI